MSKWAGVRQPRLSRTFLWLAIVSASVAARPDARTFAAAASVQDLLADGARALNGGDFGAAAAQFERAVKQDSHSALARDYLGIAYLKQQRFSPALDQFHAEVRLEPRSAIGWARVADVYQAQHELKHAIEALERAVKLDPKLAQLHFNLGVLYPQYLQLARGAAELQRCTALEPENHYAHFVLAGLLLRLARLDEAQSQIERAVALQPGIGEYHFTLGRLLLDRRSTPETLARAMIELDRAVELGAPETGEVHYYRGLCLQRQGRWQDSLAPLREAARLEPDLAKPYHELATAYLRLGRSPEARAALARFRPLSTREEARLRRSFFEQETVRNRDDPDAYFQLGAFLESRGDVIGAVRALRQAAELADRQKSPVGRRRRIHARLEQLYRRQGLRQEADGERGKVRRLARSRPG